MSGTGGGFFEFTEGNVLPNTVATGTSGGAELVALKQGGGRKHKRKTTKKKNTKTNRKLKKKSNKKRKTQKK
jgi:hypothetical protein|uniref:Uncharacterized protein n=1 Tax=viral metagenome TaxID=1070528 RepID=A0A6C0IQ80_9ZZZZ